MKILIASIACALTVTATATTSARRTSHSRVKPKTDCAQNINDIRDCPDQGCGSDYDPQLNVRKNVRSVSQLAVDLPFRTMQNLANPKNSTTTNRDRGELQQIGEGRKITVIAYALAARRGNPESCNCGLSLPKDTDNHIVLVDPTLRKPTLKVNEPNSETAEFTPRVRLSHPNFTRDVLQTLISQHGGKLLVRVTGQLMFDSEHFLRRHLVRRNNWEVHPVLKMEYCANGSTCSGDATTGWVDLDNIKLVRKANHLPPAGNRRH